MKARFLFIIALFLTFSLASFGQSGQERAKKDWSENIRIYVSEQTGDYYPFGFPPELLPVKGLKIKEGRRGKWNVIDLREIEGFTYQEGIRYTLRVKKTHLAYPPADARSFTYKLKRIVRRKHITAD